MEHNYLVIAFILAFIAAGIFITWYTSRRARSTTDFYVAGRHMTWIAVGIAMTGSYLSAASFLGCAGDIGVFGVDGIWLSIGFFGGYMALLLLIAGPLRNVGSYTVADAVHRRFPDDRVKLIVMITTLVISTFYLVPQMLGAGLLFGLLLGWDFVAVTVGIGVLVSIYIVFGGMRATLYNQILQAVFLWGAMVVITMIAFFVFGDGSIAKVLDTAAQVVPPIIAAKNAAVVEAIKNIPADQAIETARSLMPTADSALTAGVRVPNTLSQVSTVIGLVFGTAGLPHILILFYTVRSARAAKKSVTLCIVLLGIFYLCAILLGFLLFPGIYSTLVEWTAPGGKGVGYAKNMAVVVISETVGGKLLMAVAASGAVAAVLSTAAGLMIASASTISHDLYKVYVNRHATERQELMIAKVTTVIMATISIVLAILLKKENVAWLVTLAFGIAASAIFPTMLATLWWRRATRQGVMAAMVTGLTVSVFFIILLLSGVPKFLGLPTAGGPGVFGVTAGFLVLVVVSLMTQDRGKDVETFFAQAHKEDHD